MDALEIYVLCESRSAELAQKFLDAFLPKRTPIADEYPYPEFEDEPTDVFLTAIELMHRLEVDATESYSIYFDEFGSTGTQAMLFYTEDGAMIAGVSGLEIPPNAVLQRMAAEVGGEFGYLTSGSCPPETRGEFIALCRNSALDRLVEGQVKNR